MVLVHAFLRVFSFSPAIISSIIHQNPRIIKKKTSDRSSRPPTPFTNIRTDTMQNRSCKFPLTDTRVAAVHAPHFVTKHPRTHYAPSHPQCTQPPTMHLASCSHQQQVEWDIVASVFVVLVVSCACLGCACFFFLWFLDIVASILVVFHVCLCFLVIATSHRFSGIL